MERRRGCVPSGGCRGSQALFHGFLLAHFHYTPVIASPICSSRLFRHPLFTSLSITLTRPRSAPAKNQTRVHISRKVSSPLVLFFKVSLSGERSPGGARR